MEGLQRSLGSEINSNRRQINKNTRLVQGLLSTAAIRQSLECDSPDLEDGSIEKRLCAETQQEGAGRKKRKTRKRRRKKRTKKKTRRKRRKSRKRKTKRRRKKKTRKRKAGCWPFCKPKVLEEEPLVQQQPQEARTMTPQEREDDNIQRLLDTSSGNRSLHTERRNRRLAANEAAAKKANNTQGGD